VVARQLEFSPKSEPIIKTATKKAFVQPRAFGDTKANIGTKTVFLHWEELLNKIKWEEFPKYTSHINLDTRRLNDEVLLDV
jgi:hypothetical protein